MIKKIKRLALVSVSIGLYLSNLYAVNKIDSYNKTLSSTPSSPTLVISADSFAKATTIINNSGYDVVCDESNIGISTITATGNAHIPAFSSLFLDGVNDPWRGNLYCVGTTSNQSIDIIQVK